MPSGFRLHLHNALHIFIGFNDNIPHSVLHPHFVRCATLRNGCKYGLSSSVNCFPESAQMSARCIRYSMAFGWRRIHIFERKPDVIIGKFLNLFFMIFVDFHSSPLIVRWRMDILVPWNGEVARLMNDYSQCYPWLLLFWMPVCCSTLLEFYKTVVLQQLCYICFGCTKPYLRLYASSIPYHADKL